MHGMTSGLFRISDVSCDSNINNSCANNSILSVSLLIYGISLTFLFCKFDKNVFIQNQQVMMFFCIHFYSFFAYDNQAPRGINSVSVSSQTP